MADGRRQPALIAVATATRMTAGVLMGTALAVWVGERGSPLAVSLVLTAYFLGMMVFAPVWGAIADVTGRRRGVLVGTGGLATLAVLVLIEAGGVAAPISVRWLYAVFAAGYAPVMLSIVSARGGDARRGRSMGFYNSSRAVGFTAGQLAAGAVLGFLAPSGVVLVMAAASLCSTAAVAYLVDPTPSPAAAPTVSEVVAEVRRRLLPAVDDRAHLQRNGLRWLYLALALRNMTVLGVMSLIPPFLLNRVDVTTGVMGILLAVNPASQVVFMHVFGRSADRAGRKPFIVLGMAGSGVFALLAAAAPGAGGIEFRIAIAALAFLMIGASYSAMTTGALAFIGDVSPAVREGELMGLRSTAKGVGGVLGPPLVGIAATVWSHELAFGLASGLALLAAGLAWLGLTESRPDEAAPSAAPET